MTGNDWSGKGDCITCARDKVLGNSQGLDGILNDIVAVAITLEGEPLDKALNVQKQALLAWHNKQVEEVLDRLEQADARLVDGRHLELDIPDWVEAERNKLKESADE